MDDIGYACAVTKDRFRVLTEYKISLSILTYIITTRVDGKTAPVMCVGPYRFINQINANHTTAVFKTHKRITSIGDNNFARRSFLILLLLFIVTYAHTAAGRCAIGRLINICLAGADRTHYITYAHIYIVT